MTRHLAIFSEAAVKKILNGEVKVEARFSQKRIGPFGKVSVGDIVYIKPPGKEIVGQFRVKKVLSWEGLDKADWEAIIEKYGNKLSLVESEDVKRYCTLIFMDQIEQFIASPIKVKKSDLRGWMVLG